MVGVAVGVAVVVGVVVGVAVGVAVVVGVAVAVAVVVGVAVAVAVVVGVAVAVAVGVGVAVGVAMTYSIRSHIYGAQTFVEIGGRLHRQVGLGWQPCCLADGRFVTLEEDSHRALADAALRWWDSYCDRHRNREQARSRYANEELR